MIPADAPILTVTQMRAAEEAAFAAGVSQDALMERAGLAVAREVARLAAGRPVLILAGCGNNGGDGYVAARHLADRGHDVVVAALGDPATEAARSMARAWRGRTVSLANAEPRVVVVDALLGTGCVRPFEGAVLSQIERLFGEAALRIAIDVPSGLDADDGVVVTAPGHADVTIALGALKPAHVTGPDAAACGHVLLGDIGIQTASDWRTIARPRLTAPTRDAHKYTRGMVVVVGGPMPGAAALAASAALHGGAGYVVLTGSDRASGVPHSIVQRRLANADDLARLLADERIDVVVIGPGLGRDETAVALLDTALASPHALVVDGDALSLLGTHASDRLRAHERAVVLTPHAGEFARVFPDGEGGKIMRTVAAARASGATIIHKGPDTVIARGDGSATVSADATSWLSTAGTGDVLAGLVAARLANGAPGCPASDAVWLHARAARLAGPAFAADDLIRQIPPALTECTWT